MLLENLIQPDNKVCRLRKCVNWNYLENKLGHFFADEQEASVRLVLGLLYLQSIDDLSFAEVIEFWEKSPEWQYFCGEEFLNETFPLHHAALSIWSRTIGATGRQSMTRALGDVSPDKTFH